LASLAVAMGLVKVVLMVRAFLEDQRFIACR